ncbi:MAG: permease prefix domain 2-containing transporter [Marinoscillum sp.]
MSKDLFPPKLTIHFLRWFCDPQLLEDVEGDLQELFNRRVAKQPSKARIIFYWDVLVLFRPGIIRSF